MMKPDKICQNLLSWAIALKGVRLLVMVLMMMMMMMMMMIALGRPSSISASQRNTYSYQPFNDVRKMAAVYCEKHKRQENKPRQRTLTPNHAL
jgi:hypothetical protein